MHPPMAMAGPFPGLDDGPARFSFRIPWRVWMVASPMMVCFVFPILRVRSVIYVYDLLTIFAIAVMFSMPRSGLSAGAQKYFSRFTLAFLFLAIGVVLAMLKGFFTAEYLLYTVCYAGQYILALIYGWMLFRHVASRQLEVREIAVALTVAAAFSALLVLAEAALFQVIPQRVVALKSLYLRVNGFNDMSYEGIANMSQMSGMFRASGGWDWPTPVAGMIALGSVPLVLTRWPLAVRAIFFVILFLGTAATLSRHGVAILLIAAMFFFVRGNQGIVRRVAFSLAVYVLALIAALAVGEIVRQRGTGEVMDFVSGIRSRIFERTYEQNINDSSFEARYITGSQRFFRYVGDNPETFFVGYGLGVDKSTAYGLGTNVGRAVDFEETGFVSNCWLLVIWQFGLWGWCGLFILHWGLLTSGRTHLVGIALVIGLVVLADNYAIVSRCYFLLTGLLSISWGVLATARAPARVPAPHPGSMHPRALPPRPLLHDPRRAV